MAYTPEQIAKLKATDPAIVRQALGRLSGPERDELMAALKGEVKPQGAIEPQIMSSHTPGAALPQSVIDATPDMPVTGQMQASHTPGAPLPESIPGAPLSNMEKMVLGQDVQGEVETTAAGLAGAASRGLAPYAAGSTFGAPGVATVAAAKLVGDPLANGVNSLKSFLGLDPYIADQLGPSQVFEKVMDKLGIYKPRTSAERVVQAGAEAAGSGLGTVKAGEFLAKQSAPVVAGVGRTLAAQPAQQIAGGAGAGMASQTAAEMDAPVPVQIGAGLLGGVLGAKTAAKRGVIPAGGIAPSVAEAEKEGIRVMTSDVMPPRTFASKWLQSMGEKIPVAGTGGPRQAQQAERIAAVKNLAQEYGVAGVAEVSDDVARDLLAKRQADLTKYVNLKEGVIGKLDQAGAVDVTKTVQAIDKQIAELASLNTKEALPIIDRLTDWKTAIQGQGLKNVDKLRAQIGESFKAPELAASRSLGEKSLSGIYGPLKEDMGNFIKANGDRTDYTKWRVANSRLSESMKELNKDVLKNVLDKAKETPEVVQRMLFSSNPSDVKALMSGLTANGKANAKVAILAKVLEESGGIENLSPEKFITAVRKRSAPIGVAFDGQEAQRLKGLVRALKLTEQASKSSLVTPTGVQTVPIVGAAVLTDLLGGSGAALATMGGVGGLARAYESAPVRNILMKLPSLKPGSPEEAALFKRLMNVTQGQQSTTQKKEK